MYKVEAREFGFLLVLKGKVLDEEMQQFHLASVLTLKESGRKRYGILLDIRELLPVSAKSRIIIKKNQRMFKKNGLMRGAIILGHPETAAQFIRMAKETGVYEWGRFIDTFICRNWERAALNWIVRGIDPNTSSSALQND